MGVGVGGGIRRHMRPQRDDNLKARWKLKGPWGGGCFGSLGERGYSFVVDLFIQEIFRWHLLYRKTNTDPALLGWGTDSDRKQITQTVSVRASGTAGL